MGNQNLTRRDFLQAAGFGIATSILGPVWANSSGKRRRKPNFLVIFTDDQTYRAIGYNNPEVKTPALDSLAAEGIIFENAYVASPICVASRASILTSLFPQQHEAVALKAAGFKKNVITDKKHKTLAHDLTAGGYRTALYGKSHLGNPTLYGFQAGQHTNDEQAFRFAENFLENASRDEKPFLLWLAPHKPHIPLRPDQKWLDLYKDVNLQVDPNFRESPPKQSFFNQGLPGENLYRDSKGKNNYKQLPAGPPRTAEIMTEFTKAYYATISYLDYQIGRLISRLKALDLYDNTVIIFLSDNGYFLGNHGLGNKITMHEESVRVPMFIHWNHLPKRGIRCSELVSSLDVYPTLLDLASVAKPSHLVGKSLTPLFADHILSFRKYVAGECVGVGGRKEQGHRMIRTKKFKYILSDSNDEALFDEIRDPYEMKNLAALKEYQSTLDKMRQYLRDWMDSVNDTHPRPPS